MKVYSYVVRYDFGFAPNPFYGVCSLATCKPDIRARASVGDLIIGTGSASKNKAGRLVYAMTVDETLQFDEYWSDQRFFDKRSRLRGSRKQAHGDNIYHREGDDWVQEDSRHSSSDGSPNPAHIRRDTATDRILLGRCFSYFGGDGPAVPAHLRLDFDRDVVLNGRGYLSRFGDAQISAVAEWARGLEPGVQGRPQDWPIYSKAFSRAA